MSAKKREAYLALADEARASKHLAREIAALERAIELYNPVPIPLLFRLAEAERRYDLTDESAARLTSILRRDPNHIAAGRQLSLTLLNTRLEAPESLDPFGLQAALRHPGLDYDSLGRAAFDYLIASTPFGEVVRLAEGSSDAAAAKAIADAKTYLTHPLLHAALRQSVNRRYDVERLLTAIRRHMLLDADAESLARKEIFGFALSLIAQCWNNEHVFAETEEEKNVLAALTLETGAGNKLNSETTSDLRLVLLSLLYLPLKQIDRRTLTSDASSQAIPKALKQLIEARLASDERMRTIATTIPSELRDAGDAITVRVSQHYEQNPYPRWISFHHPVSDGGATDLAIFFSADELAFLSHPYRVLVAGAGTGRHALGSAIRYQPHGRVLAIDLSRASLAYAAMKAEELSIEGIAFLQADLHNFGSNAEKFDIIEAVGVLHHTADTLAAWQALLDKLKPGGLMWVGLYSAIARDNIKALRQRSNFPGASASDAVARAYRIDLIANGQTPEAQKLMASDDFYALSDFRDLVMNAHEAPLTLPEIETFLADNGLEFRGFTASPALWRAFKTRYPDAQWPGAMDRWHAFENENPTAFDAMYQFWCLKTS